MSIKQMNNKEINIMCITQHYNVTYFHIFNVDFLAYFLSYTVRVTHNIYEKL